MEDSPPFLSLTNKAFLKASLTQHHHNTSCFQTLVSINHAWPRRPSALPFFKISFALLSSCAFRSFLHPYPQHILPSSKSTFGTKVPPKAAFTNISRGWNLVLPKPYVVMASSRSFKHDKIPGAFLSDKKEYDSTQYGASDRNGRTPKSRNETSRHGNGPALHPDFRNDNSSRPRTLGKADGHHAW